MQIVTLTTDWGYIDHYIGVVKGRLYSTIADVNVVDITHNIKKYDLLSAAFVVRNACMEFPEGTIHIIDVNSYEEGRKEDETKSKFFIAIKHKGQYYICTDNGLPSMVFGNDEVEIVQINLYNESNYYTFEALDLFAKVAKNIAEAGKIDFLGISKDGFENKIPRNYPIISHDRIKTEVIYIDDYGNAFLNITANEFAKALAGRGFCIMIDKRKKITKLSQAYADNDGCVDDVLLTISSTDYLQLAVREGSISELRGLHVGSSILIEITNNLEQPLK